MLFVLPLNLLTVVSEYSAFSPTCQCERTSCTQNITFLAQIQGTSEPEGGETVSWLLVVFESEERTQQKKNEPFKRNLPAGSS